MFAIVVSVLYSFQHYTGRYNAYQEYAWTNLIQIESGWAHWKRGKVITNKNAVGIGQITPIAVVEYNRWYKTKYKFRSVNWRKFNLEVSRWYFFNYCNRRYKSNLIKMINAYNMGPGNTDKDYYNMDYLYKIIPNEFTIWVKGKKFKHIKGTIWKLIR